MKETPGHWIVLGRFCMWKRARYKMQTSVGELVDATINLMRKVSELERCKHEYPVELNTNLNTKWCIDCGAIFSDNYDQWTIPVLVNALSHE